MFGRYLMVLASILIIGVGTAQSAGFVNCGANCNYLPVTNICAGAPETVMGVVESVGLPRNGLVINTASGSVTLYGVGPYWYWDKQNIAKPDIGETVTAVIAPITTSNNKVILSMTIESDVIQLRDNSTCLPLWRSGFNNRR